MVYVGELLPNFFNKKYTYRAPLNEKPFFVLFQDVEKTFKGKYFPIFLQNKLKFGDQSLGYQDMFKALYPLNGGKSKRLPRALRC
jgi:hypothetical protein